MRTTSTPKADSQRREFTRVRLPIVALVTVRGVGLRVTVCDFSLDGIGVKPDPALELGAPCTVELRREEAIDETWVTAEGTVARAGAEIVGIQFEHLVGLESLDHYRALLLYHAEDPDEMVSEFNAHWGLRPKTSSC